MGSDDNLRLELDGQSLNAETLFKFAHAALKPSSRFQISFSSQAKEAISKASQFVSDCLKGKKPVYGINTGFGKFAEVTIDHAKIEELQRNLILSHCCGVGENLPRDTVMAMWILRLNTIARGHSGVSLETLEFVLKLINGNILPEVPSRGSVGASGDLAPSAHATLMLLGEGFTSCPVNNHFKRLTALEALDSVGLKPIRLKPKEGLSLINGTQLTTALAARNLTKGFNCIKHANLALAMSIEGLRASRVVVSTEVLSARNHPGAMHCGIEISEWLNKTSEIGKSHENCDQVQDPYSLRCAPQVHGAILDEFKSYKTIIEREMNSSTDNPLLFPASGLSTAGGNFHAIYTARANDNMAAGLTVLSNISERRIALAMSPKSSRLPAFLIQEGGFNSGFMMAQVTAARSSMARTFSVFSAICEAFKPAVGPMETWSSRSSLVGIESTLAGWLRAFDSLTSAAAVT